MEVLLRGGVLELSSAEHLSWLCINEIVNDGQHERTPVLIQGASTIRFN